MRFHLFTGEAFYAGCGLADYRGSFASLEATAAELRASIDREAAENGWDEDERWMAVPNWSRVLCEVDGGLVVAAGHGDSHNGDDLPADAIVFELYPAPEVDPDACRVAAPVGGVGGCIVRGVHGVHASADGTCW